MRFRDREALSAAGALAFSAAVGFYGIWEWHFRHTLAYARSIYPIDDADEWRYTACSRLVAHGYPIFKDVFSAQPPLLFASLAVGMRVVADNIAGARTVEVAFGLLALLSTCWLAAELAGPVAAGAAALLLALSPAFLVYSRAVEAEGPMMALMTLALALAVRHRRSPRAALPVLSGLALAGAILTKLFALEVLLPALWLVVSAPREVQAQMRDAGVMLVSTALPVAAEFALVAPGAQWRQVVQMHEAAARLSFTGLEPSWRVIWDFLTFDAGLSAVALAGLAVLLALRRWREAALFALWVGGVIVMLFLFHPLFPHHPAILLTGLAACAGTGIGAALNAWRDHVSPRVLLPLAAVVYAVFIPRLAADDRHVLYRPGPTPDALLSAFVAAHSAQSDIIAADDLRVADDSHRLVVPTLCDPSNVRLRSGYMTTADVVAATSRYRPQIVLFSFGIFQQVPGYEPWLRRGYALHPLGAEARAYVRNTARRG